MWSFRSSSDIFSFSATQYCGMHIYNRFYHRNIIHHEFGSCLWRVLIFKKSNHESLLLQICNYVNFSVSGLYICNSGPITCVAQKCIAQYCSLYSGNRFFVPHISL
jgi:hypothetical protein